MLDTSPDEDPRTRGPQIHVAEYVRVRTMGQVFGFMRMSMRIFSKARAADGFLAGGIRSKWWSKQFWTYTVWGSREEMEEFVNRWPHAEAVERVQSVAAPGSCYVEWISDQPIDWADALARLERPTRYFVAPPF